MFYSEILADFLVNLNEIPNEVKQRAKELMLDSIGTALAASNEESVMKAVQMFQALPHSAQKAEIWGRKIVIDAQYAAMCNGIAAHALDYDDTHTEAILHASAILTPLILSYGFTLTKDTNKLLKAFIVAWEISARIGIASKGTFHKRGFHTTAICGSFAATVACGVMLDLNKEQMINALGFAASFASGVNEFLSNGSNSKLLHIGNAIKNGILTAHFAKANLNAPVSIFEGRDNIFRTFGIEEHCDKSELTKGLNDIWQTLQVSIKPYPCCHFAHGLIECALALRKDNLKASEIKSIHCFVDEVPISFICEPLKDKFEPKSAYQAKFSLPFLMSLAFNDGFINFNSYANLNRNEIVAFAKKISYEKRANSGFPKYFCGHIQCVLANGNKIKKDVFINKGNPDNPLTFDELKDKFLCNAQIAISKEKAQSILKAIMCFEKLDISKCKSLI